MTPLDERYPLSFLLEYDPDRREEILDLLDRVVYSFCLRSLHDSDADEYPIPGEISDVNERRRFLYRSALSALEARLLATQRVGMQLVFAFDYSSMEDLSIELLLYIVLKEWFWPSL